MKRRRKVKRLDGSTAYEEIDLYKKCNLNYLHYVNLTHVAGAHGLPALACNTRVLPDYIALSGYPGQFHKTPLTAVGFWEYDEKFDGPDGLFNAIKYGMEDRLEYYKKRFSGVRIFFTPDYSQFGDVGDIERDYRLLQARVVGIWLAMEIGAVVIPFITIPTAESIDCALDGLEDCSVVAFSTKGYVNNPVERGVIKEIVRRAVDTLRLKTIVVYDVCSTNDAVADIFSYAKERGIHVVVPPNALKERNMARREALHEK